MTLGQASHSSVRRIGPSTSAFLASGFGGGSGRSSWSTGISGTAMSGNSVYLPGPDLAAVPWCFLPRSSRNQCARGAMGACRIAGPFSIFTSPRLRGEVGFYAKRKIRVRGILPESRDAESPPPPHPLPPARGGEELAPGTSFNPAAPRIEGSPPPPALYPRRQVGSAPRAR